MKAIIPVAGKGTRLWPHTLTTPKPLLKVGGRPVMSYILDDLRDLGVQEIVFVVGYLRDVVRAYIEEEYPDFTARFVVQEVQDGTAGAIQLAEPYIDDEVLIVFVDTLFDADLSLAQRLSDDWAGVIWAKEVEDYQRFGVILTDEAGAMTKIVEKPTEPVSKLANIGLYHIRDWRLLFEGIHHVLGSDPGPAGEYFLTDAFQYMVDKGARIRTAPVGGWYDCGKTETLLETNRHLVETSRRDVAPSAIVEASEVDKAVRVEAGASVVSSVLGSNVTVEQGAIVDHSSLRDCVVGANAVIRGCNLHDSIIGANSHIENLSGVVSAGPHTHLVGSR
jgi:glucose-1-phosphate thymidylyltransferase